jgi:ElaB/YqjD/DUF883 family membrane-anchored ribosome-binding protein
MNEATQQLQETCEKAAQTLSEVARQTEVLTHSAWRNARAAARAADQYVHRSPWALIGAAALVAAAVGYVFGRREDVM